MDHDLDYTRVTIFFPHTLQDMHTAPASFFVIPSKYFDIYHTCTLPRYTPAHYTDPYFSWRYFLSALIPLISIENFITKFLIRKGSKLLSGCFNFFNFFNFFQIIP